MTRLAGLRALIVEDEAMIAMLAEDMLDIAGCRVVAVAGNLADGKQAIERDDFDIALLDYNLSGEYSTELATRLKEREIPFIFTTGYGSDSVSQEHDDVPVLAKPYVINDLHAAIELRIAQTAGTSSITSMSDSKRG